jgi:hypothetical protein
VRELSAKTHTASLIASDLKGTEEPDGAFGGGSYPSVRESPVMMALRNQSLPTTVTSFFRRVSVTLIMGAPGTSLRVGRARCVLCGSRLLRQPRFWTSRSRRNGR